jgi:hemerythrin-like metal-binding protein
MAFIAWEQSYSVGVKAFDEDHKQLISFVNKLHISLVTGESAAAMGVILKGLVDYTLVHFRREEELMHKLSYPGIIEHKKEHAGLVKQVSEFLERFESGKTSFSIELMGFLRDWLINHIQKTDMNYKIFFMDAGVS